MFVDPVSAVTAGYSALIYSVIDFQININNLLKVVFEDSVILR